MGNHIPDTCVEKSTIVATVFSDMHEHPDVATAFKTNLQGKVTPCLPDLIGSTELTQRSGTLLRGRAPACQACRVALYAVH